MKWLFLALFALAQAVVQSNADVEQVNNPTRHRFKYERYHAQSGALCDDLVKTVFVDSKGHVWVGTVAGLAIYDGNIWTNRTFDVSSLPLGVRLLGITNFGPRRIVEGPPATVWLGGDFGVWRV